MPPDPGRLNVQKNWKDALISTLDFLKSEIKEKNVVINATLTRDDKTSDSNRSNIRDNNLADSSLIVSYMNEDLIQFSDASFNKQHFDVTTRQKHPL